MAGVRCDSPRFFGEGPQSSEVADRIGSDRRLSVREDVTPARRRSGRGLVGEGERLSSMRARSKVMGREPVDDHVPAAADTEDQFDTPIPDLFGVGRLRQERAHELDDRPLASGW
jgi:hypothetical protein